MADGIIQFIKLALDQASLKQLRRQAAEETTAIGNNIARTLQGTGPEGDAILKYVTKIRTTFEANLSKIRDSVAQGLVDIPAAERQADRVAKAFTARLQQGIERLGNKAGMPLGAQLSTLTQALPRPGELSMAPRGGPTPYAGTVAEMAKAGKAAGNAWAENFAPIVHGVMSSDATWTVKAAALMKLGARAGDAWADGVRSSIKLLPAMFGLAAKDATDRSLVELQKNMTGYSRWQEFVRGSIQKVKDAYANLREKAALVTVPDAEVDPFERARLKKKSANTSDYNQKVRQLGLLSQLAGTQLTGLGKAAQFFGINVAKNAPQVQALITKLQDLGTSGTIIGRNMPFWANGMNRFGSAVTGVAKAFGLYYSVRQALEFIKGTVTTAGESQVAWAQLSSTLSDYGHTLSELMPQIRPVVMEQEKLGVTTTESAHNLARLVQITGDVQGALRALPVVQDMAASGFMTLEQASKQVGRAMLGDIGSISRYGIFLDKTKDILDQLSASFGGEQLARAQTLTGSLERVAAAWYQVKVAMGTTLAAGAMEGGGLEKFISWVKDLHDWVLQNEIAFKTWGSIIADVMVGFATFLKLIVGGFVAITNAGITLGIAFHAMWDIFPKYGLEGIGKVELAALKMIRNIAAEVDQLFGTRWAAAFDEGILKMERGLNKLHKDIDQSRKEHHDMIVETWMGVGDEGQPAPDQRLNPNVRKIRAREHRERRSRLSEIRSNVLSDDLDARELGLKKLAEIEKTIADRTAEEKDNEWALIELGKDRAIAEKIRHDLEKKVNKTSKEEIEYNRHIARLTAIAREADDEQAMKAVRALNAEHDKLLQKRKGLSIGSTTWEKNEVHIKNVEEGINGHLSKQNQLFDARVKKLAEMVDLDVNRADAVEQINSMIDDQQKLFDEAGRTMQFARKNSVLYNKALNDQIVAKNKIRILETALRRETDLPGQRIDELEKELDVADKRIAAEKELESIIKRSEKRMITGKTPEIRAQAQADRDHALAILEAHKVDLDGLEKEISAAKELTKHGDTRTQGVAELQKAEDRILELLTHQNLKLEERLDLEAKLRDIRALIAKLDEPVMNMWDSLRQLLEQDGPKMAESMASGMVDVFDGAFQHIMRDSRLLGKTLSSIPKGFAMVMLQEIGKIAKGKALENLAYAIEETARGFAILAGGNPALAEMHFQSAAEHTAAAAAWGLVGAGAGALGQSASAAYANASGDASGSRGGAADGLRGGPDIYLTIDGVDPSNPRHQKLIGDTAREYAERYGGQIIYTTGR